MLYSQGVAQYYDLFAGNSDLPTEASFLQTLLPQGSSILDIGAGTGTLALALAADRYKVTALESDPEMYAAMLVRLSISYSTLGLALTTALMEPAPVLDRHAAVFSAVRHPQPAAAVRHLCFSLSARRALLGNRTQPTPRRYSCDRQTTLRLHVRQS